MINKAKYLILLIISNFTPIITMELSNNDTKQLKIKYNNEETLKLIISNFEKNKKKYLDKNLGNIKQ